MKIEPIELPYVQGTRYVLHDQEIGHRILPPSMLDARQTVNFAEVYHNENLARDNNRVLPYILLTNFDQFRKISLTVVDPYELPAKFRALREEVERGKGAGATNGKRIGVQDYTIREGMLESMQVRETGYFDFLATNVLIDHDLSKIDSRFSAGHTLRQEEVKDGRAIPINHSNLANIIGIGYQVLLPNGNALYVEKGRYDAVASGTINTLGGTPEWDLTRRGNLQSVLEGDTRLVLSSKLGLTESEYGLEGGFFLNELTRGPTFLLIIRSKVDACEIANRSAGLDAAKQYISYSEVPLADDTLAEFCEKLGIPLYDGTRLFHRLSWQRENIR